MKIKSNVEWLNTTDLSQLTKVVNTKYKNLSNTEFGVVYNALPNVVNIGIVTNNGQPVGYDFKTKNGRVRFVPGGRSAISVDGETTYYQGSVTSFADKVQQLAASYEPKTPYTSDSVMNPANYLWPLVEQLQRDAVADTWDKDDVKLVKKFLDKHKDAFTKHDFDLFFKDEGLVLGDDEEVVNQAVRLDRDLFKSRVKEHLVSSSLKASMLTSAEEVLGCYSNKPIISKVMNKICSQSVSDIEFDARLAKISPEEAYQALLDRGVPEAQAKMLSRKWYEASITASVSIPKALVDDSGNKHEAGDLAEVTTSAGDDGAFQVNVSFTDGGVTTLGYENEEAAQNDGWKI